MIDVPTRDAALKELQRYRHLLDNIPAEIAVFDPEGRFLFSTPSGIRDPAMREWVVGKTQHEYCRQRGYPAAVAERRQAALEQCAAEQRAISFEEIWTDRQGGRRYYVRTFGPVLDVGDQVTHVIGYGQEITQLKAGEDALRQEVSISRQAEEDVRREMEELRLLNGRLLEENLYLQDEIRVCHNFEAIIGESPPIMNVIHAIETVAPTEANVVVTGETGTGKELVARALHALSPRKDRPLIKIDCASVPNDRFESVLFGDRKGAVAGVLQDRTGRLALADGGTLLLDEVGDIPADVQRMLLRVLQEGGVRHASGERTDRLDVRIIAASTRDLGKEVAAGRFNQDLYYRLNVFPIEVAPLRRRRQDIALLATHYLRQAAERLGRQAPRLTAVQVRRLQHYDWPGNVRELENVMQRAVITARSGRLHLDLPDGPDGEARAPLRTPPAQASDLEVIPEAELRRRERENTVAALRRAQGRIHGSGGAAALLGIKPTTLASRLRKMGLQRADFAV